MYIFASWKLLLCCWCNVCYYWYQISCSYLPGIQDHHLATILKENIPINYEFTCILCNYECVSCLHSDEDRGCVTQGQFIQTHQYHGHWYGLQMQSIEDIAREGLACVVHMELEVRDLLYTWFLWTCVIIILLQLYMVSPVLNLPRYK